MTEDRELTAGEIMTVDVLTVAEDQKLWDAWTMMTNGRVRHLIVTTNRRFETWNEIFAGDGVIAGAILDRLLAGGGIILFPEGTRTRDGNLQPARSGIGLTVIKSAAPVVPVRVFGTDAAFGRQHRFPRPKRVSVKYGKPMLFANLRTEAKSCTKPRLKEIYQQVANELMDEIGKLRIDPAS